MAILDRAVLFLAIFLTGFFYVLSDTVIGSLILSAGVLILIIEVSNYHRDKNIVCATEVI